MSDALTELVALTAAQPEALIKQANPDHATWQQQVAVSQATVLAARQAHAQSLGERDGLQAQINDMEVDPPPPMIENRFGKLVTNKAYAPWKQAHDALVTSRNAAQARVEVAQGDIDRALAVQATLHAQQPPTQLKVPNPERAAWAQRLAALRAQLVAERWDHVFDGDSPSLARWRAALAGQAVPDQDVVDAFVELVARHNEAERIWHAFDDQACAAEDEAWRLQVRVAELDRVIARAESEAAALAEGWGQYQAALRAVAIQQDNPPEIPGREL